MNDAMTQTNYGFIGAGQMATALAGGMIEAGLATPAQICAADPFEPAREAFAVRTGAVTAADNREVLTRADVVILAVKPQHAQQATSANRDSWDARHLLISIVAGLRLAQLHDWTGRQPRLVRVMPNTPCLVGASASGFCLGPGADDSDRQLVSALLGAVGSAHELPEKLLDAVTGLAGSGPAFVYQLIEALSDGGVQMGLPRAVAADLAAQTVLGAARMVIETGEHPAVLKDRVASPGGTTIAGLAALEQGGFRAAAIEAVRAATRRSTELGDSA